jgi:hypothetical protein
MLPLLASHTLTRYYHCCHIHTTLQPHRELRDKIAAELDQALVWDTVGEDHSAQDLAADKRAAIEARLEAEERAAAKAEAAGSSSVQK